MGDPETTTPPVGVDSPPLPPIEQPPAPPPPPPPPEPKPEVDLATTIMAMCDQYRARLYAIKQGLFAPINLVNSNWQYYSALGSDDQSYLSEHIVSSFRELEQKLVNEMSSKVAQLIGR